jgi:hypothetical protein
MSKEAKRYSCGNGDGMIEDKNGFYVKYSQPTLFKVATEDSCVVLEVPDAYDDYYRDANGGTKDYFDAMVIWNKAPSISEDRLELNKLRVENEKLKKTVSERLEYESMRDDVIIEANKQHKEYKEVVDLLVSSANNSLAPVWLVAIVQKAQLLSKLNKD